jgi:rubredoxin
MAYTVGFICPKCKSDRGAAFTSNKDIVRILELKCNACGFEWAVERGHDTGFRNTQGRVRDDD